MTIDLKLRDIENMEPAKIEKVHNFLKDINKPNYYTLLTSLIDNEIVDPEKYKSFLAIRNIPCITTEEELQSLMGENL